jgi:hypothetical protein
LIDGVPDTPDATDFQYQVNRPRPSRAGLEGVYVNRLSKWSVGAYQLLTVTVGAHVPNPHSRATPLHFHLRLELDISTSADFQGLIPQERVENAIDDLFDGAIEVCERGNHL